MECLTQFTVELVKEVTDEFKPSGCRSTSYKDAYSSEFIFFVSGMWAWSSRSSEICVVCMASRSGHCTTKSLKVFSTCMQRYERVRLVWE